jgi:hypothetical protein
MFDEKPPEDIFAGTEKPAVPQPAIPRPPTTLPPPTPVESRPPVYSEPPVHKGGAVKTIVIVLLALVALGTAAYLAYAFMMKTPESAGVDETPVTTTPDDQTDTDDEKTPVDTTPATPTFVDSDGDGLTNAEELEAGTSSTKADTDEDGLGDREEVKVYGTDPRRTDTDGDGYLDGAEVKSGYNPNGEGKLLEVPKSGS